MKIFLDISGAIESRTRISDETCIIKRHRNYTYFKQFPFLLERKRNHIEYFHCIQRYATKCKARLIIKRFNSGEIQFTQLKEHNHCLKAGMLIHFEFISRTEAYLFLEIFSFQITNQFCTFNIKDIYFLSITNLVKKPIGDAHN